MVRGPSNSQLGRNGMTNMATRATRPIQGVSTCGIIGLFPRYTTPVLLISCRVSRQIASSILRDTECKLLYAKVIMQYDTRCPAVGRLAVVSTNQATDVEIDY